MSIIYYEKQETIDFDEDSLIIDYDPEGDSTSARSDLSYLNYKNEYLNSSDYLSVGLI